VAEVDPACAGEPPSAAASRRISAVDPRVRGGASAVSLTVASALGPACAGEPPGGACEVCDDGGPPRARGSQRPDVRARAAGGWTPACAGEPRFAPTNPSPPRVDPRVRGGATLRGAPVKPEAGGPPRARGSQNRCGPRRASPRWTPACAGSLDRAREIQAHEGWVDPRVRGGAISPFLRCPPWTGGPPRARGRCSRRTPRTSMGVDPRVRGGAPSVSAPMTLSWVDPRVRGGAIVCAIASCPALGGPPRARGSRGPPDRPRVRGGAQDLVVQTIGARGGPPRARGSPLRVELRTDGVGWTPACAGEPRRMNALWSATRVDPRVRGGAQPTPGPWCRDSGGPPRARGSREGDREGGAAVRWTPACAGEPGMRLTSYLCTRVDPRVRGGATARPRFTMSA